ncbi:MAG: hypothetical protein M9916_09750 [Crocinitomicaceae bacterium]|nr:hypothetical protein [Crocinitomicaceae bacterium]
MGKKSDNSHSLNSQQIVNLLLDKASLKQDVYAYSLKAFNEFKELVRNELDLLRNKIDDNRIRLSLSERGQNEFHTYVGSDVLVYQVHTNIFRLPEEHPLWQTDYLKENPSRGFFGIIHIYNFLAESFLQNRLSDLGHLIGRIFVNMEGKFFVEGSGQLGFLFKDLAEGEWSEDAIRHIIQVSFAYAISSDLYVPPYEMMQELNVEQVQTIGHNERSAIGKRLGFLYKNIQED